MKLYPYQEEGAEWLASRKYGLLADEMRLGKTPQAIVAADRINAQRILVPCPAVASTNWSREFAKFSSRTRSISVFLSGSQAKTVPDADILICSYDLTQNRDIASRLRARRYDVLILDESHYLKSPDAARTKAVLGLTGLVHLASRVWCLTGTPAPNHSAELWTTLRVFGRYSKGYDAFVSEFCETRATPYGVKIIGNKNVAQLRELLNPIMLRRTKAQVRPDLPQATYTDVVVEASKLSTDDLAIAFQSYIGDPRGWKGFSADVAAQKAMFDEQFNAAITEADKLAVLERTMKSVATLRRYVALLKVRALTDLVSQELDNGLDKIVIFALHKATIDGLHDGLAKYGAVKLYGGTNPARRDRNLDRFNNDPKCRVFIVQIHACGVAISLAKGASDVLFAEYDWVPMNNAQAAARVDGPEQTNPIFVRFAVLAGSIDEHVARTVARKTKDLAQIFDA